MGKIVSNLSSRFHWDPDSRVIDALYLIWVVWVKIFCSCVPSGNQSKISLTILPSKCSMVITLALYLKHLRLICSHTHFTSRPRIFTQNNPSWQYRGIIAAVVFSSEELFTGSVPATLTLTLTMTRSQVFSRKQILVIYVPHEEAANCWFLWRHVQTGCQLWDS